MLTLALVALVAVDGRADGGKKSEPRLFLAGPATVKEEDEVSSIICVG